MKFANNKFFLLGILGLLLISIPLTLFFIKKQQQTNSNAEAASTVSFIPSVKTGVHVGDDINLNVSVDPGGKNIISVIRLQIKYDPAKLELKTITPQPPLTSIIEPLNAGSGSASIVFGIGSDVTQAIQTATTAAVVTFKALAVTDGATSVSFDTGAGSDATTQILSLSSNDNPGENVLSTTSPATITIEEGTSTVTPTITPTGTVPDSTITPTTTPVTTSAPVPTAVPNQEPICSSLGVDRDVTGSAPLALTFTATGSDTDGTVSKVTFNFGDGPTQDVTTAGGIGTNAVSVPLAHTYNNAGTYQVTSTLVDNDGALSSTAACTKTVTVTAASTGSGNTGGSNGGSTGGNTGSGNTPTTPVPTLKPGTTATVLGIVGGAAFIVVGILLFAL